VTADTTGAQHNPTHCGTHPLEERRTPLIGNRPKCLRTYAASTMGRVERRGEGEVTRQLTAEATKAISTTEWCAKQRPAEPMERINECKKCNRE
jgi:hypothetical protein